MSDRRYVILTLEDAKIVARALTAYALPRVPNLDAEALIPITARLLGDTGADIEDIVAQLKGMSLCPACVIEGQERSCSAPEAQKLGRRLNRLLERARGERAPGLLSAVIDAVTGKDRP